MATTVSATARMAVVLALICLSLLTADYVLHNRPQAAQTRRAKENAAAVRTAREMYARLGCLTINGEYPADLTYLAHQDCACEAVDDPQPSAASE